MYVEKVYSTVIFMRLLKRSVSILLTLTMMIGILVIIPLEASAATGISYIYRSWDGSNVVEEVRTCTNYTVMDGNMGADLVSEWYVVNKNVTIDKRLYTKTDTVNIILCDGATLTLKYGITVRGNDTLNFFGQKKGTGTLSCKIHLKTKDYNDYAIIGGDKNNRDTGKLHFYGGCFNLETKDAIWDYRGACIGGGVNGSPKEVVIYGGAFDLNSNEGACIGGGKNGQASRDKNGGIRIYNASIRAYSWGGAAIGNGEEYNGSEGPIEIYGGVMQLYGRSGGAGIGGGGGPGGEKGGSNGPISIYGGLIFASASGGKYTGAGIGGGQKADQGGAIRILGGNVTASSASGAGIGAGATGDAKTIEILGGTVTATATAWGAGIGGGSEGSAGTITIKNAYVTAESSNYGDKDDYIKRLNEITAGLGMKTDQKAYVDSAVGAFALLVDLFNVDYSGAAIGSGHKGSGGTITIVDSTINAKSGHYAAGIGGGEKHGFDAINITGGKLDVTGGKYGAGIGTGDEAKTFGPINITNANVTVHGGEEGAGIGTGNEADSTPTINITDSRIYAYGGKYAAAIGGGDDTGGGNTTIRNSYVYATGGYDGAGIGGGEDGNGGTIKIYDSYVHSGGRHYGSGIGSGIGGGEDAGVEFVGIYGNSYVVAVAGVYGNGVAIGNGDYNKLFRKRPSRGTLSMNKSYYVYDGNNYYYNDDRWNVARSKKLVEIFQCRHNPICKADNAYTHSYYCMYCGMKMAESAAHTWDDHGNCTKCKANKDSYVVKYVERDDKGTIERSESLLKNTEFVAPDCTVHPDGYEFMCWRADNGSSQLPGKAFSSDGQRNGVYQRGRCRGQHLSTDAHRRSGGSQRQFSTEHRLVCR